MNAYTVDLLTGKPDVWVKSKKSQMGSKLSFEQVSFSSDPQRKKNGK